MIGVLWGRVRGTWGILRSRSSDFLPGLPTLVRVIWVRLENLDTTRWTVRFCSRSPTPLIWKVLVFTGRTRASSSLMDSFSMGTDSSAVEEFISFYTTSPFTFHYTTSISNKSAFAKLRIRNPLLIVYCLIVFWIGCAASCLQRQRGKIKFRTVEDDSFDSITRLQYGHVGGLWNHASDITDIFVRLIATFIQVIFITDYKDTFGICPMSVRSSSCWSSISPNAKLLISSEYARIIDSPKMAQIPEIMLRSCWLPPKIQISKCDLHQQKQSWHTLFWKIATF